MTDIETQIKFAAEKAVLKFITDGGWLMPDYSSRIKVPTEWLAEAWKLVDSEKIKRKLADRLEDELVDRIVNHMAAELATDIKQILSVKERREALRAIARTHFDDVMAGGRRIG